VLLMWIVEAYTALLVEGCSRPMMSSSGMVFDGPRCSGSMKPGMIEIRRKLIHF
jgi:hypothetical protein